MIITGIEKQVQANVKNVSAYNICIYSSLTSREHLFEKNKKRDFIGIIVAKQVNFYCL